MFRAFQACCLALLSEAFDLPGRLQTRPTRQGSRFLGSKLCGYLKPSSWLVDCRTRVSDHKTYAYLRACRNRSAPSLKVTTSTRPASRSLANSSINFENPDSVTGSHPSCSVPMP